MSNHDNENVYFSKLVTKIIYLDSAQKHVKIGRYIFKTKSFYSSIMSALL